MRHTLLAFLLLAAGTARAASVELVQSIPAETELAHPALAHARDVWPAMIRGARTTIDIAQMYVSHAADQALEPVLAELERAGERGVRVRLLLSSNMLATDPSAVDRLRRVKGLELRALDLSKLTGGVLHAKYWVIDGEQLFVGSQNLDWKALSHIHETGALVRDEALARQLTRIFETDWEIARTGVAPAPLPAPAPPAAPAAAELVASPPQFNPPGTRAALDAALELLGAAKKTIRVQLLNYSPESGGGRYWPALDNALRAAAVRGVKVELLMSDWNTAKPGIDHLKSLSLIPNLEVRIATIPEHSSGFISFARVIHSKLLVVDDETLWVGTSNWSHGYFSATRGVELIFRQPELARTGAEIFGKLWASPYAAKVDPLKEYVPPRRE
jgi:phosphatidylserine/phosphatidylglycerophosphate/cardiolipin synthase-like enzyme